MVELVIRGALIALIIYVAVRAYVEVRDGMICVRDTDEPAIYIVRATSPLRYWFFVGFLYLILAIFGVAAITGDF